MAILKIKRRTEVIIRPYEFMKKIKQRWGGDDTVTPPIEKASKDAVLDLGDEYTGTYGQIESIELNDRPRASQSEPEDVPLSDEEKKSNRHALEKVRKDLEEQGFLGKKSSIQSNSSLLINRSALVAYKQKFGREYDIPEGFSVVEDLFDLSTSPLASTDSPQYT